MSSIKEITRKINTEFVNKSLNSKIILFVTPSDAKAQATLIANLALMYGQASEKTLILDADFSHDIFSEAFGIRPKKGLSDFINDGVVQVNQVINSLPGQHVSFVSSGNLKEADTKYLMGDPRFKGLLKVVNEEFEHILINAPIFNKNADTIKSIINVSDGVVIVAELNKTTKKRMFNMVSSLKAILGSTSILGYINSER